MKRVRSNESSIVDAREAVAKRWMSVDYKTLSPNNSESDLKIVSETCSNKDNTKEKPSGILNIVNLSESDTSETEIEVKSGDESDDLVILYESTAPPDSDHLIQSSADGSYSFKLIRSDIYDTNLDSEYFITMNDILHDPHIRKTALFSFQYDMNFLLNQFCSNIEQIIVVAQENTIFPLTDENLHLAHFLDKITTVLIKMPPLSCHHSKLIINQYDNGDIRLFLPSNNLTRGECLYPQQVCWCSARLPRETQKETQDGRTEPAHSKPLSRPSFKTNLLSYLQAYNNETIDKQITPMVEHADFSVLKDVDFIFSVPNRRVESGVKLLQRHVKNYIESVEMTTQEDGGTRMFIEHILCQTSTIGGSTKNPKNIFLSGIIPAVSTEYPKLLLKSKTDIGNQKRGHKSSLDSLKVFDTVPVDDTTNVVPHIVYPTIREINRSPYGTQVAGWFHFRYTPQTPYFDTIRNKLKVFYKQNSKEASISRRLTTPCHSKFYFRWKEYLTSEVKSGAGTAETTTTVTPTELDWCLYTSANASLAAWGSYNLSKTNKPQGLPPRNYEVGVLLHRKPASGGALRCYSFVDLVYGQQSSTPLTDCVIVPFTASLSRYEDGDEPWSTAEAGM